MKKILAVAAAGAMLVSAVLPVLAHGRRESTTPRITADVAFVKNSAVAESSTGLNVQGNVAVVDESSVRGGVEVGGNNSLTTGDASANATAVVVANTHVTCCEQPCQSECSRDRSDSCACESHFDVAAVENGATATAYTDMNVQGNDVAVTNSSVGGSEEHHHRRSEGSAGSIGVWGDNTLTTGAASSEVNAWTVVNTHYAR